MDETLKTFLDSIEAQSRADIAALGDAVAEEHRAKTEHIRAQAEAEAAAYKQAELASIAQQSRLAADARRAENRRRLLALRGEYAAEASTLLEERVRAYTEDAAYPARLAALAERAVTGLGAQGGEVTLYLRREDMRHAEALRKRLRGVSVTVAEDAGIAFGGVIAESAAQGRRADMSFDTALRDARSRFGELFDMEIS